MKCPKCGYHRQTKDNTYVPGNECPSCGIVYDKHFKAALSSNKMSESSGPLRNPSPVSASSLRKARERVERRLRKKQVPKVQDLRHIKTLEMARRLTAEGVRQRQAEWSNRMNEKTAVADKAQDPQAPIESSDQPLMESKPKEVTKQLASTIAKALDKQQRVPKEPIETKPSSNPDTMPQCCESQASQAVRTEIPDRDAPLVNNDVDETSTSNEPIPLFQSKAKTDMNHDTKPPSLKEMLKDLDSPNTEKVAVSKSINPFRKIPTSGIIQLLPLVAWLILGAGIIGTILSWTTLGDVQAAMESPSPTGTNTLPLGLLLGFAYLATGVLGFAFFWVSSLISRQLKDIRQMLLMQPPSIAPPETTAGPDKQ